MVDVSPDGVCCRGVRLQQWTSQPVHRAYYASIRLLTVGQKHGAPYAVKDHMALDVADSQHPILKEKIPPPFIWPMHKTPGGGRGSLICVGSFYWSVGGLTHGSAACISEVVTECHENRG